MKKFLAMALAAVMVLALAACGSKNDTADDTGDAQDAQGGETQKLIVGFDAEFPPFGFIAADGSYDGFDLAMAKELCARLGWEYDAIAIDWNSKDASSPAARSTASGTALPTPAAKMTTRSPTPMWITPS